MHRRDKDVVRDSRRDPKSDETREVRADDRERCEAETGSAGDGASPWGADLSGCQSPAPEFEEQYDLERDPSHPEDIVPDKIERGFSDPDEEEREVTAQPEESVRPITPDLLPSDDPGAREG